MAICVTDKSVSARVTELSIVGRLACTSKASGGPEDSFALWTASAGEAKWACAE